MYNKSNNSNLQINCLTFSGHGFINKSMKVCGIIAAGGSSQRFGANKLALEIAGKTVLEWSQYLLLSHPKVTHVITASNDVEEAQKLGMKSEHLVYIKGGNTRQESIRNAFMQLPDCDVVLVHDGARPFASARMIDELLLKSTEAACVIPVIPCTSALKTSNMDTIERHIGGKYVLAQTPQLVWYEPMKLAFEKFASRLEDFPDESSMIAELGTHVKLVPGSSSNIKITTKDDETLARALANYLFRPVRPV